jgi:hypothetical protein
MLAFDKLPGFFRQGNVFCEKGMDTPDLLCHPTGYPPHGEMGLRGRAQLAEGEGFA